jgi:cytochrome c oxidase subunit 2
VSEDLTERSALRRRRRRVAAAVVGSTLVLALTGCTHDASEKARRLGLPPPASNRSTYMSSLWIGSWIACLVVGVVVWGLIAYCAIRFRRKSDDEVPKQIRYHLPIEMLYTVAPLIVVAVFFYFTVEKQDKINADVAHPDHSVFVTAQQWSWTFSYLHEKAIGGTNVYDVGTVAHEPQLWLVKGQSVTFDLHSPDVIHDFWVPSFYFKLDVIPGRDQSFSMTPDRYGTFDGRCAEFCGYLHSQMLFTVHVVTQTTYDAHLRALKAAGAIGVPKGGSNSSTVAGLDSGNEGSGQ